MSHKHCSSGCECHRDKLYRKLCAPFLLCCAGGHNHHGGSGCECHHYRKKLCGLLLLLCACGHNHNHGGADCECDHRKKLLRKLCGFLLFAVLLALFVLLVVYLVLRPHKPRFYLQDLAVLCLNVTPPASAYLFTTMQATVAARNINDRVGVYYDSADVYAQYKGAPITVATRLPVAYQGHRDQSVWSPYLRSMDSVVLSPQLAVALAQDETAGYVLINIRVDGLVRWKVGTWISGHYHLKVNCPALIRVNEGKGSYGATTGGGTEYFRFQEAAPCAVDV